MKRLRDDHPRNPSMTPFEQQVAALRRKYPGIAMVIQVGYRYKLFDEDAVQASKILNIVFIHKRFGVSFGYVSFPIHRLLVHVRRLISEGLTVGIFDQVSVLSHSPDSSLDFDETSCDSSQLFQRRLTRLYSQTTFIDADDKSCDLDDQPQYLLCIQEKTSIDGQSTKISTLFIDTLSASVIYDEFTDCVYRTELRSRLSTLSPKEVLLHPSIMNSSLTRKAIDLYISRQKQKCIPKVFSIESVNQSKKPDQIHHYLLQCILSESNCVDEDADYYACLDLPLSIQQLIVWTHEYLKPFQLESVFLYAHYFPYNAPSSMMLSSRTLDAIEIFRNNADGSERNTLWSCIDRTVTKPGRRLLQRWLRSPLSDKDLLKERKDAVSALMKAIQDSDDLYLNQFIEKLNGSALVDWEKILVRAHYGRCSQHDLIRLLQDFNHFSSIAQKILLSNHGVPPEFCKNLTIRKFFLDMSDCMKLTTSFLSRINTSFTDPMNESPSIRNFFKENIPGIETHVTEIKHIQKELQQHLEDIQEELCDLDVKGYVDNSGISYLLEVSRENDFFVPESWIRVQSTGSVTRYHTPMILNGIQRLKTMNEEMDRQYQTYFKVFQSMVSNSSKYLQCAIAAVAQFDCLFSLAKLSLESGRVPVRLDMSQTRIRLKNVRHPILDAIEIQKGGMGAVENDIVFDNNAKTMILTGPNMGGKSCYSKMVALIVIMNQIGCCTVPANPADEDKDDMVMGVYDGIFVRSGASDDIFQHESTFMYELLEMNKILKLATESSLVIVDELGRGTSTRDGIAIAFATLKYLMNRIQCTTLFVTHYSQVMQWVHELPGNVRICRMNCVTYSQNGTDEVQSPRVVFYTYKLEEGLADNSHGAQVALLAGIPSFIVQIALEIQ